MLDLRAARPGTPRRVRHRGLAPLLAALFSTAVPGLGSGLAAQQFEDARGDMTFALTGDAIITRHLSPYREPEFLSLRELIEGATAAFTNLEILFHDYEDDVIPAAESGGTYMRAEPELAGELAWMGFDLVSMANNHSLDFGLGGARRTIEAARAAGLVTAGVGENLAEARAPGYLETPGGRVALISIASTFADGMRAGHQRSDMRGRPGLSPIRYETRVTVTEPEMAGLTTALARWRSGYAGREAVTVGDVRFATGSEPGVTTIPHEGDLEEILGVVREARRQADWVIVTSHTHESAGDRNVPADFIVTVARAAVEAGADMFVGHGPHVLRGIEIHEGKPIFYSLANFIFQNETVLRQPADNYEAFGLGAHDHPGEFQDVRIDAMGGGFPADPAYWESVVALPEFRDGALHEIRLHPVTLGHGLDRAVRGRPMLAGPELGGRILSELADLSAAFGTRLAVEDGVGVIRP